MKHCYEFLIAKVAVQNNKGQITNVNDSAGILVPVEAEEELDKLLEKFDKDGFQVTWGLESAFKKSDNWPWAIVFYREEFRLAGHVVSTRKDRSDVSLTSYTMPSNHSVEEHGVPTVSVLLIYTKNPLKELAEESELFSKAWEQLSDCDESRHWICIAESPSEEWIKKASKGDDQLFLRELGIDIN